MADEIRIPYEDLLDMVTRVLAEAGLPEYITEIEAEIMIEADVLGVPSHGVAMLPGLIRDLKSEQVNDTPKIRLLRDQAATCVMNGDFGPGRYAALQGMQYAMERAGRFGAGICLAANMMHWGRAHAYAYRATQEGFIGICATNAMTNMLAFGSPRPLLGNNPLAIGVPMGSNKDPIVLDMAMSQAAIGKIFTYRREGKAAPANWGLDEDGRPTADPNAIINSGKVLPMGDHKGSGLSLMIELLTGALAGGLLSYELAARTKGTERGSSKIFVVLDVSSFTDPDYFVERVSDLLAFLRQEAGQEVRYPGERGWRERTRNMELGVPIHREIATSLRQIGLSLPAV